MVEVPQGRVIGEVLVDGEPQEAAAASVSALDIGLQRGYGCFEALRAYGGKAFRAERHCERLAASARRLLMPEPDRELVLRSIAECSAAGRDCVIRVYYTGGLSPGRPGVGSRLIVYAEPLPSDSGPLRVLPLAAPWHADGAYSELTGAKTLSYGPNLAAGLAAQRAGFDDALLVGRSGSVLEGPTYGVAWVVDGVLETPSLDLGILESITRGAMLEVAAANGIDVVEGRFPLERMLGADEAIALSTIKEILPIGSVGQHAWSRWPVADTLSAGFRSLVSRELSTS